MKAKYAIAIIITGVCLDFAGSFFRITHQRNTELIFLIAALLKIAGALALLYKIWVYPKFQDFLNR